MKSHPNVSHLMLRLTAVFLSVVGAGCPTQQSQVQLPEREEPVAPGPQRAQLVAFMSADRPRIIRDDAVEGGAVLTATTSVASTFRWSSDAPAGLLEVTEPDPGLDPATESVLRIGRVLRDPGLNGTTVRFMIVATRADAEAGDTPEEAQAAVTLQIVRPRGPLAVTASALSGNTATPGSRINLRARISGGRQFAPVLEQDACTGSGAINPPNDGEPYLVSWLVNGLAGGTMTVNCLEEDDGETVSAASFATPVATGNVIFTIQVSDASGNRVSASVPVVVSSSEALAFVQASSESATVAPGEVVALTAQGRGGTEPYEIRFSINRGLLNGRLSGSGLNSSFDPATQIETITCRSTRFGEECAVDYTASARDVGSELVSVTLVDAVGATSSTTIALIVAPPTTLRLTARSLNASIEPGAGSSIEAAVTGGTEPYKVCFEATGPTKGTLAGGDASCDANANCSCNLRATSTGDAKQTRTYTAAVAEGSDIISVRVEDAVGGEATAIVPVVVRTTEVLSLSAIAADTTLNPDETTTITATATGGKAPYAYSVTKVDNLPALPEDSVFIGNTSLTTTGSFMVDYRGHSAAFFNVNGVLNATDVITVKVTDAVGQTRATSFTVFVGTLASFDVFLVATPAQVAPGGISTISADFLAGTPPFEVTEVDLLNAGFGGFSPTCPGACVSVPCSGIVPDTCGAGGNPPDFTGDFTAPTATGDQQIKVTFRDASGLTSIKVVNIGVVSSPLRVSADAAPSLITPGGMTTITAAVAGGAGASEVTIEALGLQGGSFDHDDCNAVLVCDNTAPFSWVYTAPLAQGTVLFRVTAQGIVPGTDTDFATVEVRSAAQLDVNLNANSTQLFVGASTMLTANVSGGTPPYTYIFSIDPTVSPLGTLTGQTPPAAPPTGSLTSTITYNSPMATTANIVRVTVTDAVNASASETVSIAVSSLPLEITGITRDPVSSATGFVIEGRTVTLTANVTGGVGANTFSWSVSPQVGGFTPDTMSNPVQWMAPAFSGAGSNLYTHTVVVNDTDPSTGAAQNSTTLTVIEDFAGSIMFQGASPPPGVDAGEDVELSITVAGGQPPYSYDWTITGPAGNIDPAAPEDEMVTFTTDAPDGSGTDTYMVTLTVTDALGNTYFPSAINVIAQDP